MLNYKKKSQKMQGIVFLQKQMDKIWKKIGKQKSLPRESQLSKGSQNSIELKQNDMGRKECLSPRDVEGNKKRFDLSECLSISDDSIQYMNKKKVTINQEVYKRQSNSISLEDENLEHQTPRQQSQFTQFQKDLEEQINLQRSAARTEGSPFYDFATFSDLSKWSESRINGQKQKQKLAEHDQIDSFSKNKIHQKEEKLQIQSKNELKNLESGYAQNQIGEFQPILDNLKSQKNLISSNKQREMNKEKQINDENSQIFSEQQIQEVIDLQSQQFIKSFNHFKFSNLVLNKQNSQVQISQSHELKQKTKQNENLKQKVHMLSLQIQNLKKFIREKEQKTEQLKRQRTSFGLQTEEKQGFKNLTCCFQRQKSELNQKFKAIENLNNFQRSMKVNSDGDTSDFLNFSVQLNLLNNKRIVIKNRQSLQELQQYIFDLEQKITFDKLQLEEKTKKIVYFTELKMKQKYNLQIQQIKKQLEITKAKYEKLKLLVKRYQKQRVKRQNEELEKQKQPKSPFDEMIKNVSDFHRLLTLFNQFNQNQSNYINDSPHATLNSPKRNFGKKQNQELYSIKQFKQKQIQIKNKEQSFEQIQKEIQSQWDMIQKVKMKCLNSSSKKQIQQNTKKLSQKIILRSPDLKKRQFDPFSNQKKSSFQAKKLREDSRSENMFPLSEKQKLFRYQSPQSDRRFCSQYDAKQWLHQGNFRKSKSPQNDYDALKRRKQKQYPQNHQNRDLRQNKTVEDKKNLFYISSKLTQLQKDIKTELKSINC